MQKSLIAVLSVVFVLAFSVAAFATNGDNLMGIGPISRSMGGVGIASPQDPISAVFANPAAMCFGPYCPGSEFNFAATVFDPTVKATVKAPGFGITEVSGESKMAPFIIPAIGISQGVGLRGRFGIAAYGVSGLGVDYRDQLVPFEGYSLYQVMKFAPNYAHLITDDLSVGASIHVDYAALDLQQGTSHGYTAGAQVGAIYKLEPVKVGISYVTAQKVTHERVFDFDGDGTSDSLDLESPQTIGAGVSYEIKSLLVEGDVKWLNWADAEGYKDFDWEDQIIYALGAQYKPMEPLALRAGVNYGKNPVKTHDGFDPMGMTTVQGKSTSTFGYEYLRTIAFPAIAETHLTAGAGYQFTKRFAANVGYTHALNKEISETSAGDAVTLESELAENSYEFGFSWRF